MPCGLVFKSRVDQEAIFGCEAQLHAGRNTLFFAVPLPGMVLLSLPAAGTSTTVHGQLYGDQGPQVVVTAFSA